MNKKANICEALAALLSGKHIRNDKWEWAFADFVFDNKTKRVLMRRYFSNENEWERETSLVISTEDILKEDWEILEGDGGDVKEFLSLLQSITSLNIIRAAPNIEEAKDLINRSVESALKTFKTMNEMKTNGI